MEGYGSINMHDYRFNFGVVAKINETYVPLPAEFGRFRLNLNVVEEEEQGLRLAPMNCTLLFPDITLEKTEDVLEALPEA